MYSACAIVALLGVWLLSVSAEEDLTLLANQATSRLTEKWGRDLEACSAEKDSLQVHIETKKAEVASKDAEFIAAQDQLMEIEKNVEQCKVELEKIDAALQA